MRNILKTEKINHGPRCLIDVYRAPGDLYDSWEIVYPDENGEFDKLPDAGYGPDAAERDVTLFDFEPMPVTEHFCRWDEDGYTQSETYIKTTGGKILAYRGT
jgi:hypothetical protein